MTTTETKKYTKPEKWEIDTIGQFLLQLYHRKVISQRTDWYVLKTKVRYEFSQFLNTLENCNMRDKFKEHSGSADIGSLLFRTRFLINTPRGSEEYRIRYTSLFQYSNQKLEEYDEIRKNDGNSTSIVFQRNSNNAPATPNNTATENKENEDLATTNVDPVLKAHFEVDDAASYPLMYQGHLLQTPKSEFRLTNMGCYICELNFETADEYEQHVEYHGDESDFESLNTLTKCDTPDLVLSYMLCKNSHYFCFTLENRLKDIIIDKIIIVQPRSMYYVHNQRVPYALPASGKDTFFVDSHLFTIYLEQPIVVVFHDKGQDSIRRVEQHHFMRTEEFPLVRLNINPHRLPSKNLFKPKFALQQYLPPAELYAALDIENATEHLLKMSNEFNNYHTNDKTLTQVNIREALNVMLQVEDMATIKEFHGLIQRNAIVRAYGNECSVKIKSSKSGTSENIISPNDEVMVILENSEAIAQFKNPSLDLLLRNSSDIIGSNKKKIKIYFGRVERICNGRVTFKSEQKLPQGKSCSFMVIFRPSRLTLRYQFRALELLQYMAPRDINRFLFPQNIAPLELPCPSLILHNTQLGENPEQLQAVRNIAMGPHNDATYVIFGPPGTGKTTTITEAILQLYLRRPEAKILVTAGSNTACDEIALRLVNALKPLDEWRSITRIYSLSNEKRIDNIDELLLEYSNMYSAQFYPSIDVLHEYRIVVCTIGVLGKLATGKFGKNSVGKSLFTHVFIDEVAASTEAETLVSVTMLSAQASLIISGDHKQLGPIVQSPLAKELGLDKSLMDRLMQRDCYRVHPDGSYNTSIQTRLRRNYRSHPEIVNLFNRMYYDNELMPMAGFDVTTLCANWHKAPNPLYPIIFHSVDGFSCRERTSVSLYNLLEVGVVMDYVKELMYYGVNGQKIEESDIGIISPYKRQYLRIQDELNLRSWYKIEAGSVELFQGKEKRIIIVSFVRSSTSNLGFLDNPRRLNVTLSRPKSLLILIGNPKTLSMNSDFKFIIDECTRNGTMVGPTYAPKERTFGNKENVYGNGHLKNLTKSMEKLVVAHGNEENKSPIEINSKASTKKPRTSKKHAKSGTMNANADNANEQEQHHQQQLGQPMKKSLKPTSHQKQRKNFVKYKNLMEETKRTEIDDLFDELPSVPLKGDSKNVVTAMGVLPDCNFVDFEKDIHERMLKLNLKPPPSTAAAATNGTNPLQKQQHSPSTQQNMYGHSAEQQQNRFESPRAPMQASTSKPQQPTSRYPAPQTVNPSQVASFSMFSGPQNRAPPQPTPRTSIGIGSNSREYEQARQREIQQARQKEIDEARQREIQEARQREIQQRQIQEARLREIQQRQIQEARLREIQQRQIQEARLREINLARQREIDEARQREIQQARLREAQQQRQREVDEAWLRHAEEVRRQEKLRQKRESKSKCVIA